MRSRQFRFQFKGKKTVSVSLESMGVSVKQLGKTIEKAVGYGKEGNPVSCYRILRTSEKKKHVKTFPLTYAVTEKSAEEALTTAFSPYLKAPEDARLTVKNGKTKLVDDVSGEELDLKQTVANVNALLGEKRGKTPGETKVVFRENRRIFRQKIWRILRMCSDLIRRITVRQAMGDRSM